MREIHAVVWSALATLAQKESRQQTESADSSSEHTYIRSGKNGIHCDYGCTDYFSSIRENANQIAM